MSISLCIVLVSKRRKKISSRETLVIRGIILLFKLISSDLLNTGYLLIALGANHMLIKKIKTYSDLWIFQM